jgi:hypothetical protein
MVWGIDPRWKIAGLNFASTKRNTASFLDQCLSFWNQHTARRPRIALSVRRRGRKGLGQPSLTQAEGRLGPLEGAHVAIITDNVGAHAPGRLYDEISDDYTDMIYAKSKQEVEA